ncbi:MAG: hypothetical protein LLG97_19670 [Deltaproteobacteria bacterium]|nr:hypothetical protein [Deltaproteobacteria bacterium]
MSRKSFFATLSFLMLFLMSGSAFAQTEQTNADERYHERIRQLWNNERAQYLVLAKKSGDNLQSLYSIQNGTNNLLKYAAYCQKYSILDDLSSLYLQALDTLTETDQYLYAYYPGGPRRSVHSLDRKYRMWLDKQGGESILSSSQYLYLLSDTVSIIADIKEEKRTPIMKEALNKFIPLLIEHYNRWIFNTPGPFQVRGWGCRFNGRDVPTGMNHLEYINKRIDKQLGNGKSPAYCNAVTDTDMWIIAGVANILATHKKEKDIVPISQEEYKKLLNYLKAGIKLLESRFSYTELKNFDGQPVAGAIFQPGVWDEHPDFAFAGYSGKEFPKVSGTDQIKYQGKGVGWDLSHARRLVHVFETLMKSKNILDLDFPTKEVMVKMANQLVYASFNRDFTRPLFSNFMDGTNGWYRVNYDGRPGSGYGPGDMSISILTGGYGFWSRYNADIQKLFVGLMNMLESNDPEVRKHVIEHYEMNYWSQYKRLHDIDFRKKANPHAQSVLIEFLPSLCFINSKLMNRPD